MKILLFSKRNIKEILRDPLNLAFGLGFPLAMLAILTIVNKNIPADAGKPVFAIENLAPGLAMFGTVFMSLFAGMLIAKDRSLAYLSRLFVSPLTSKDFLIGYSVPLFVIAAAQGMITLFASLICGLAFTAWLFLAVVVTAFVSVLFIALGLLCGSVLSDKAVGGFCGALFTNLAGWLSGVFIPLELIGGGFKAVCGVLPFYHGVEAIKDVLSGDLIGMLPHLGIVLAYAAVIYIVAVFAFRKKMRAG
ncbi:MAG: ABC transporter permease [Firmicutes bacterium]|nr:ABC transporter permease [Bacillota bacterium]